MKPIKIKNGIQVQLADDAHLICWEESDGWNIEVVEFNKKSVRIGIKEEHGIYFQYLRDLLFDIKGIK